MASVVLKIISTKNVPIAHFKREIYCSKSQNDHGKDFKHSLKETPS